MIKLSGVTLRVKKIKQGRFGDFCVADLVTDIGDFKVKDPLLDQFDDGEYTGTVWISEIFLAQYIAWGKGVTEIRARLHDLQLDAGVERDPEPEVEPDPVEEAPLVHAPRLASPPAGARATDTPTQSAASNHDLVGLKERLAISARKSQPSAPPVDQAQPGLGALAEHAELFGDLWPLIQNMQPVKFDPTVDRLTLRKQSSKMGQLGYKFNPIEQTWYPV